MGDYSVSVGDPFISEGDPFMSVDGSVFSDGGRPC
jgi:hypothetical protein